MNLDPRLQQDENLRRLLALHEQGHDLLIEIVNVAYMIGRVDGIKVGADAFAKLVYYWK